MVDIFSSVPLRARDISGNLIRAQIKMHEKDLFSGLFHIGGIEQSVFLFAQGKLFSVYKLLNDDWVSLSKSEWDQKISRSSGDLRVVSLAVEGLRVFRLFFESGLSEADSATSLAASELNSFVSSWKRENKAGIVLISQNEAVALMLFAAQETAFSEAALVSGLQTQTGSMVANQIKTWGERICQVTAGAYNERSEAWREYSLRISFGKFIQSALERYGELVGQSLITDINEQVNDEMRNWGIELALYGSGLSNRQFFETLDRAGQAYVTIFNLIDNQIKAVVGEKVVAGIYKDAIMRLDLDNRILVQEYVMSRLDQGLQERA